MREMVIEGVIVIALGENPRSIESKLQATCIEGTISSKGQSLPCHAMLREPDPLLTARRHKHEEHANHEAWAIPYGDLITLLLAFFVVMYAISSVNEGKFRVLSDSLVAAFRGAPQDARAGPGRREAARLGRRHRDQHRAAVDDRRPAAADDPADRYARRAAARSTAQQRDAAGRRGGRSRAVDVGPHRSRARDGAPAWQVGRSRDPHRHSVPERRRDAVAGGRAGAAAAGRHAEAVPELDPRRRPHRQSSDQHHRRSRRTGSCRRRVRRVSCTCSRARAWIRRGSR